MNSQGVLGLFQTINIDFLLNRRACLLLDSRAHGGFCIRTNCQSLLFKNSKVIPFRMFQQIEESLFALGNCVVDDSLTVINMPECK